MINLVDPVQRHIHAIMVRDSIVPDDAADMTLVIASPKLRDRQLRAMLPGVDFAGEPWQATLDDPPGRRVGRVAFNPLVRAGWIDDRWTGRGPAPHRLPENKDEILAFILQQTNLGPAENEYVWDFDHRSVFRFDIEDHARISDLLRVGGAGCRLFVAASMLSAACMTYEKARSHTTTTGRNASAVNLAARSVEGALISTARIAAEIFLNEDHALPPIGRVAMFLVEPTGAFRRTRSLGDLKKAVRLAIAAAADVHIYLTRKTVHHIPSGGNSDPKTLSDRLKELLAPALRIRPRRCSTRSTPSTVTKCMCCLWRVASTSRWPATRGSPPRTRSSA